MVAPGGMRGCSGGAWLLGGCAWLLQGGCVVALGGGMYGCSLGGMVARGHAWLLWGCMVALGGMHGCLGVCLLLGACVVAPGGCMVAPGGACVVAPGRGVCGCSGGMVALEGHVWLLWGGGMCGIQRDTEIRSMSGRYASYWNVFLFVDVIAVWLFRERSKSHVNIRLRFKYTLPRNKDTMSLNLTVSSPVVQVFFFLGTK